MLSWIWQRDHPAAAHSASLVRDPADLPDPTTRAEKSTQAQALAGSAPASWGDGFRPVALPAA
jgi:hypothetical protein